jgi:hypothetical protein
MLRRITSIFLFAILASGSAVTAATLCSRSSTQKTERTPQSQCKMAQITMAALLSCCQPTLFPHHKQAGQESSGCCQMSAPLQDQPGAALPNSSSDEFRLQTQSQLLDSSQPISLLAPTPFLPAWISAITFCPDRSETYLLASTFRI